MYQTIGEEIAVAGSYDQGKFYPRKFAWRQRIYPIEAITLSISAKDGEVRYQYYSVLSAGNLYRLVFNRDSQHWQLAEVWCEG
jgi:hypothetical protein